MQTFLPFADFCKTAQVLDYRRLGKQRVEAKQILQTLSGESSAWANHPAVLMWKGHEANLAVYGYLICTEWQNRGYQDNLSSFFKERLHWMAPSPRWLSNEHFHRSHRAALLAKDPKHYGQFGWTEEPEIAYWWPTKQGM